MRVKTRQRTAIADPEALQVDRDVMRRVRNMAEHSLAPEVFEKFVEAYDQLIETRELAVEKIGPPTLAPTDGTPDRGAVAAVVDFPIKSEPKDPTATGVPFEQALAAARKGYRIKLSRFEDSLSATIARNVDDRPVSFVYRGAWHASYSQYDIIDGEWDILPKEAE